MSDPDPGPKVCATCLVPLDYYRQQGDPMDSGRYVHMNQEYGERTHVVIPVDPSEVAEVKPVCDFCFLQEVPADAQFTVVTEPFVMATMIGNETVEVHYSALWCACAECASLISRRRWKGLVKRALDVNPPKTPAERSLRRDLLSTLFTLVEVHLATVRRADGMRDVIEDHFRSSR